MKGLCWVPFAAEAVVMNGHPGHCDCHRGEHHPSSPQPSPRAAPGSWAVAVSHQLWWMRGLWRCLLWQMKQRKKNYPKDKASQPAELLAEARPGKAPCVVSSARTCCHALCPRGFLCFTRSVPSECHTAALGHELACLSSSCLSCRKDFCHCWGQCLAASRSSCTNESSLSHLCPCQEQPVFSQRVQQRSWLTQWD